MDVVLVPGAWLNAASWEKVTALLEQAGHRPHPLTLPGMASVDADRSGITLGDHVRAVVEAIDRVEGQVLLVGHSVGAGIAHAAVDARPDRVARAVYVGGFPGPDGRPLLTGLPAHDGEVPMPDWAEVGEQANIVDFDDAGLTRFYADAVPEPEGVLTSPQRLTDERRYDVPVTVVCPEFSAEDLRGWVADGEEPVTEFARISDVEYVDLPGGHWPQLTQPDKLARIIVDAAEH